MLKHLYISNYALIDTIDIEFNAGLNIITGETGAGKSIMLGALSMILGARADAKVISNAAHKSVVECTFSLDDSYRKWFEANDLEWAGDGVCILRREISSTGRSRAFINDSPVNLTVMKDLAQQLVDIHSQHQNQQLSNPRFQLEIIDTLAQNAPLLGEYRQTFETLKEAVKRLKETRAQIKKVSENADFMRFQLEKLQQVEPRDGEENELQQMLDGLSGNVDIKEHLSAALALIDGDGAGAVSQLLSALGELEELDNQAIRKTQVCERINQAVIELRDIAGTLESEASGITVSADDLEFAQNRLEQIADIKTRFGVATEAELEKMQAELESKLAMLTDATNIIKELETKARHAMTAAKEKAAIITERRKKAAIEFAQHLKEAATPLGMANLQCDIRISPAELSIRGADTVEFLFAFNKNQPLTPVAQSASGGEISRLMLCIKALISGYIQLPTILFDEIDTGVSGTVAIKMGSLMAMMSQHLQTIVITHLPQVAAQGTTHFKVYKEDDESATHTHIRKLDPETRIDELALMLGGETTDTAARANATALLTQLNSSYTHGKE